MSDIRAAANVLPPEADDIPCAALPKIRFYVGYP